MELPFNVSEPSFVVLDPEMVEIGHAPLGIWRVEALSLIVTRYHESAGANLQPALQFRLRPTTTAANGAISIVLEHGTADQHHLPGIFLPALSRRSNPEQAHVSGQARTANLNERDLLVGKHHACARRNQDLVAYACQHEIHALEGRLVERILGP